MSLTAPVSDSVLYYLRVHPTLAATTSGTATLTWSTTLRVPPLQVTALADVGSTPAWLKLNIANGIPGYTVNVTADADPTVLISFTLDESGGAVGVSVPVPALSVATHTVVVTQLGTTGTGSATFAVTEPAVAYPSGTAPDNPPVDVAQTGVRRWILQDPTAGGQSYVFPINPAKMSTPHAARVFTVEHSTAPDGQPLTFEGSPVGVDWTVEGTVRTQDFYETLETFLAMPRRVYIIDHLARAWTVTIESIGWKALGRDVNQPWAHTYTMKMLILDGPVQL